jgi:hypothetical protein
LLQSYSFEHLNHSNDFVIAILALLPNFSFPQEFIPQKIDHYLLLNVGALLEEGTDSRCSLINLRHSLRATRRTLKCRIKSYTLTHTLLRQLG